MLFNNSSDSTEILLIVAILLIILLSPFVQAVVLKIARNVKSLLKKKTTEEEKISVIQEIQTAVDFLIDQGKGATIVIDVKNETNEYVTDSELLDSRITSNLLINIFEGSKTPLHDGAVIIKENRLDRASAYITKLSEQKVPKKFGTRHRSALGLSEVTKSITLVVSEETGKITLFHKSN